MCIPTIVKFWIPMFKGTKLLGFVKRVKSSLRNVYMRYSDATLSDDMKEQNEIFMGRKMFVLAN